MRWCILSLLLFSFLLPPYYYASWRTEQNQRTVRSKQRDIRLIRVSFFGHAIKIDPSVRTEKRRVGTEGTREFESRSRKDCFGSEREGSEKEGRKDYFSPSSLVLLLLLLCHSSDHTFTFGREPRTTHKKRNRHTQKKTFRAAPDLPFSYLLEERLSLSLCTTRKNMSISPSR